MTKEDKQLLLIDICARLPHYPIVHVEHSVGGVIETADLQVYGYEGKLKLLRKDNETFCYLPIEECKPYLRTMSSMTEEEKKEYYTFQYKFTLQIYEYQELNKETFSEYLDWLNAHHFDYYGLIPKGLAIAVTKENNPY